MLNNEVFFRALFRISKKNANSIGFSVIFELKSL
jgi:hypothetical protein